MTVWFTSDLHIGHSKVAEIRGFGVDAIGVDVDGHDNCLASNWDTVVKSDDIVWVLGDISAGGRYAQFNALEWIKIRPGVKHLIAGNHDGCHPMHRDSHKWQKIYLEAFDSVQTSAKRRVPRPEGHGHTSVVLSHYPYEGDHTARDRDTQWRLRDEGLTILHGHTRSAERMTVSSHRHPYPGCFMGVEDTGGFVHYAPANQIHVGVDAWGLAPASLDDIADLLYGVR